jgi:hypothetical protein
MAKWWYAGLGLYLGSLLWVWSLARIAARSDRQLQALLNQPRDKRGLRVMR